MNGKKRKGKGKDSLSQEPVVCMCDCMMQPMPSQPPNSKRNPVNKDRLEMLAQPSNRRLRALWCEKRNSLPVNACDKLKSALEANYFMTPEQTEEYFQALRARKEMERKRRVGEKERQCEVANLRLSREREKWLTNFSAQIAYRLFEHITKHSKDNMLVSNRLHSIADVVLEKVAEILGEPKPTRTNPGRLQRFMVAVSDCIAVWIENNVFRAAAPCGDGGCDLESGEED